MKSLEIDSSDVYSHGRPLKLSDFMELCKVEIRHLKDVPFQSKIIPELRPGIGDNIFEAIKKKDLLVHHPYDSFTNSVLQFIESATADNAVLAIKITLYRTGNELANCRCAKKSRRKRQGCNTFVELKARFDEGKTTSFGRRSLSRLASCCLWSNRAEDSIANSQW